MNKIMSIFEVNLMYLGVAILLVTVGAYVQGQNIQLGLLITEYILVLLPVIIYILAKGLDLRKTLRFNRIRPKHGLMIMGITILTYPVALFFNLIVMTLISLMGKVETPPIPTAHNFQEFIGLFFIIAISAGICEEIFFRGLLLKVYGDKYKIKGIVTTAILFGVFHFNLQNLMGPIILGLIFGYLVYLTDSIYAGIIGHITNNGVAVTLAYGINVLTEKMRKFGNMSNEQVIPNTYQLFATTLFIGFIAIITSIFIYLMIKVIKKDMERESYRNNERLKLEVDGEEGYNYEVKYSYSDLSNDLNRKRSVKAYHFIPVALVLCIFIFISYLQLA